MSEGITSEAPATGPVEVTPAATEEEMAAILAAYEALWPKPQPQKKTQENTDWRFSGRWFQRPKFPR